jgi:hypothetical protein
VCHLGWGWCWSEGVMTAEIAEQVGDAELY